MKTQVLLRKIHHWGAIVIAVPLAIMIGAGILLMLKKEIDWIQPPSQKGVEHTGIPSRTMAELFEAAKAVPEAGITNWADLDRVDVKAGKGIIKFMSASNWEVQVDTETAEVLLVAFRRSDIIEKIHDGSYFAEWAKLGLFLPAGILLFILWMTGIYMFFYPIYKRRKRTKTKRAS